jgi:DNA-binding NarL/FixJ family response regulator
LREVAPQARVIVYSMLVLEGLAAEVEAMGATGFVDKGLPTESFVRRVAELAGLEVDAKA